MVVFLGFFWEQTINFSSVRVFWHCRVIKKKVKLLCDTTSNTRSMYMFQWESCIWLPRHELGLWHIDRDSLNEDFKHRIASCLVNFQVDWHYLCFQWTKSNSLMELSYLSYLNCSASEISQSYYIYPKHTLVRCPQSALFLGYLKADYIMHFFSLMKISSAFSFLC